MGHGFDGSNGLTRIFLLYRALYIYSECTLEGSRLTKKIRPYPFDPSNPCPITLVGNFRLPSFQQTAE